MTEFTITVDKYITRLKEIKAIQLVCELTQTVGGFDVNTTNETTLKYLEVENVYKRLGTLAVNNLIAVSELIKDVPDNVVYRNIKPNNIDGCEEDTGFVAIPIMSQLPGNIRVKSIGTEANTIKIASIHLPGDGPKTLKDKENDADKSIAAFLNNNLVNIEGINVDVVCGDTNITVAKSLNKDDKDNREKNICNYFYSFFNGPSLVVMSNIQVGKHRRGFMLRNQQLKKSVPESHHESEADGTIMAIKLSRDVTAEIITELQVSLGQHITCVYKLNASEEPTLISGTYETVAALQFTRPIESCVDTDGKPTEKVWLDHSVLYIPFDMLCKLTGKIYTEKAYPRNLIVVNMGSIVNSGKKNWNTQYISKSNEIKDADMEIYNLIRNANPDKALPEYNNIIGSEMTKDTIGVNNITIMYDGNLTSAIEAIANELYQKLTGNQRTAPQLGGKYKTKCRLNRRSNTKHITKHNTKTKKRTQNRYKRCY